MWIKACFIIVTKLFFYPHFKSTTEENIVLYVEVSDPAAAQLVRTFSTVALCVEDEAFSAFGFSRDYPSAVTSAANFIFPDSAYFFGRVSVYFYIFYCCRKFRNIP